MPRVLVAIHTEGAPCPGQAQWIEVDDAAGIRQRIGTVLRAAASEGHGAAEKVDAQGWRVLAYDGLPDFGPHPDVDELLVYLDAADDYGEPFENCGPAGASTARARQRTRSLIPTREATPTLVPGCAITSS